MVAVSSPDSVASKVQRRLRGWGLGRVFSVRSMLDLGSRASIDVALHRLTRNGVIRRLGRGLYDMPRHHTLFGPLSPSIDEVARAIADGTGETIGISPASAANALGISTQVPARPVYLTTGPTRVVQVGTQTLRFQHTMPASLAGGDTKAGLTLRAIRAFGRGGVGDQDIARLRAILDDADRRKLNGLRTNATGWMLPIIDRITAPAKGEAA
ncbi:MAG: hypothetical protein IPK67_18445 [Planctomycetes bacterium]|nr:hypothetical protein [Planctomycetota bacterium]